MAKAAPVPGLNPDASTLANAARILETRLDELLDYRNCIEQPDAVYELHQMRIAAKRLRYTMDIFQAVYTEYTPHAKAYADAIGVVKVLQERLGALHDADVLVPQLAERLAHLLKPGYGNDRRGELVTGVLHVDFDACQGLLTLCRQNRDARQAAFARLQTEWRQWDAAGVWENLRVLVRDAAAAQFLPRDGATDPAQRLFAAVILAQPSDEAISPAQTPAETETPASPPSGKRPASPSVETPASPSSAASGSNPVPDAPKRAAKRSAKPIAPSAAPTKATAATTRKMSPASHAKRAGALSPETVHEIESQPESSGKTNGLAGRAARGRRVPRPPA